jgi:PAS domain-containing protein
MQDYNSIISKIYDCAANPDLWPETLNHIRDVLNCAYVMTSFGDFSPIADGDMPIFNLRSSTWDQSWFKKLEKYLTTIPHVDKLYRNGIDHPWIQSDYITQEQVKKTQFYQEWIKPQKLYDCLNILFMERQYLRGAITFTTPEGGRLMGERERQLASIICPHIRRAISINDMVDKGNLAQALYRNLLDTLSVAICVVTTGGRLAFANARAETLLSNGTLLKKTNGRLVAAHHEHSGSKLEVAIDLAIKGDEAVGISGIGVPLFSQTGERAAAYI